MFSFYAIQMMCGNMYIKTKNNTNKHHQLVFNKNTLPNTQAFSRICLCVCVRVCVCVFMKLYIYIYCHHSCHAKTQKTQK